MLVYRDRGACTFGILCWSKNTTLRKREVESTKFLTIFSFRMEELDLLVALMKNLVQLIAEICFVFCLARVQTEVRLIQIDVVLKIAVVICPSVQSSRARFAAVYNVIYSYSILAILLFLCCGLQMGSEIRRV